MSVATPVKIIDAFGHAADPTTINPIPETTSTPGAASFSAGFPLDTMTAPTAGGIPPFGQDINGILFQTTGIAAFLNSGQIFPYDGTYASAIGGYALGAVLSRADNTGFWLCTAANNTTNPDTGGAGWVGVVNYGYAAVSGLVATNHTLTAVEAARSVIVLTGTLTGNINIIFPAFLQSWLVVNATTGAHTVTGTVSGGTGVVIPQGGFASPVGVYGDGTNLYYSFTPFVAPIDQAATPSTVVERTSAADILGRYFNGNAAVENPTIGSVVVQNAAADGFLRKISVANFLQQVFVNGAGSLVANGTWTFPGGLTVKWGQTGSGSGSQRLNFPAPFATANFVVVITPNTNSATDAITAKDAAGFNYNTGAAVPFNYIAIGN
jgi:hypothetical protein